MYKCLKCDFPTLESRIKAITRKLDKYGLFHNFEIISETVELIPVYEVVENAGHKEQVRRESQAMEVINYNFEMETLKLGDYIPVAVLEHNPQDGSKNMIHLIDKSITVPQSWTTVKGKCEHCNSNRQRKKTVMLMDVEGNCKQVGTSCIKDFTGIDASDIISIYADTQSILIKDMVYISDRMPTSRYTNTTNYLAHCIDIINKEGYQKDETKIKAYETAKCNNHLTESAQKKAIEIIDFFAQFENIEDMQKLLKSETSFYWNIATALQNEYTKMSGFIAYALIAYNKAVEIISKNQITETVKTTSQYQFNINDKITISVEYIHSFSYETSYNGGYSSTLQFIHIFKDDNGNVYKWNTSKYIDVEYGNTLTLSGTVKEHQEYKEEKQTVLTRCKIK